MLFDHRSTDKTLSNKFIYSRITLHCICLFKVDCFLILIAQQLSIATMSQDYEDEFTQEDLSIGLFLSHSAADVNEGDGNDMIVEDANSNSTRNRNVGTSETIQRAQVCEF